MMDEQKVDVLLSVDVLNMLGNDGSPRYLFEMNLLHLLLFAEVKPVR